MDKIDFEELNISTHEMIRKINEGEKERDRIYTLFDADKNFLTQLKILAQQQLFLEASKNGNLKPITVPCETYTKLVGWAIKGLEANYETSPDVRSETDG